jgi:iron complex transport system substrate-binding protein
MLTRLGAHNIADDAPVLLDGLSLEEILVRDPDHIFISTMGNEDASKAYMESLLRQPGWRDLTAVQEGNVHFLPRDLFHFKPNARWAEAYRYLAQLLYPELDLNA